MNTRLVDIQQRRAALTARAEVQRQKVIRFIEPWRTPLSVADRVIGFVKRVGRSPLAIPVAAIALFWLGRKRKQLRLGRLWTVWRLYSSLRHARHPGS